jgi:hypothetical protein
VDRIGDAQSAPFYETMGFFADVHAHIRFKVPTVIVA